MGLSVCTVSNEFVHWSAAVQSLHSRQGAKKNVGNKKPLERGQ